MRLVIEANQAAEFRIKAYDDGHRRELFGSALLSALEGQLFSTQGLAETALNDWVNARLTDAIWTRSGSVEGVLP